MKQQRLDKVLSNSGYGSRSEIKKYAKSKTIKVDGKVVTDTATHVDPTLSVIEINGEKLNFKENVYVMMNKPAGVITATYDERLKTVIDLLPESLSCFGLFPVGRLDIDTEGLLILTTDGQLSHSLTSPKRHVAKRYYAIIEGEVTEKDVTAFSQGVTLDDGYKTKPGELIIYKVGAISEIELIIYEGKFHQVKRMFEAVGKKVKYLRRLQIGGLKLDESVELGECRELTAAEVESLKSGE